MEKNENKELNKDTLVEYDFYKHTLDYIEIGKRIRTERENFEMTREKFSEILNISPYFLGQIERGERKMSFNTLTNLCESLHITIDYLIFGQVNFSNDNNDLYSLLNRCSQKKIKVIKAIVKLILPHLAR